MGTKEENEMDIEIKSGQFAVGVMEITVENFENMMTDNSRKCFQADAELIYRDCPLTAIKFALALLADPKIAEAVRKGMQP